MREKIREQPGDCQAGLAWIMAAVMTGGVLSRTMTFAVSDAVRPCVINRVAVMVFAPVSSCTSMHSPAPATMPYTIRVTDAMASPSGSVVADKTATTEPSIAEHTCDVSPATLTATSSGDTREIFQLRELTPRGFEVPIRNYGLAGQ